ncbi:TPA_asm: hypothetical protein [Capsaspora MELD virus 1]|nr:TPA_asm: hypothetical protein [Capsaspora MELD virus 1]
MNVDHLIARSVLGNLLPENAVPIPLASYQYKTLKTIDNNQFDQGIRFSTSTLRDYWTHIAGSFVDVVLRFTPPAGQSFYTPSLAGQLPDKSTCRVALAAGVYSPFFRSVVRANKVTLLDTRFQNLYNHIQCLINWSDDFAQTVGSTFMYAKDTSVDPYKRILPQSNNYTFTATPNAEITVTGGGGGTIAADTLLTDATLEENFVFNAGYKARKFMMGHGTPFKTETIGAGGAARDYHGIDLKLTLPSTMVSPVFKPLEFDGSINIDWEIELHLIEKQFKILTIDAAHAANLKAFTMSVRDAVIRVPQFEWPTAYKGYEAEVLSKGYRIERSYLVPEFTTIYNNDIPNNSAAGESKDYMINASIQKPMKIWVFGWSNQTVLQDTGSDRCEPYIFTKPVADANILIDGSVYYTNGNIAGDRDHYNLLREEFSGDGYDEDTGSQINDPEFISNYKLHCYDISRNKLFQNDPFKPVQLQLRANLQNALGNAAATNIYSDSDLASKDLRYMTCTEKESLLKLDMSNSKAAASTN